MVVSKQPTETFAAWDRTVKQADLVLRVDQTIPLALMVSPVVVVVYELGDCPAQRVLCKEDHAIQAPLPDGAYKAFGYGLEDTNRSS